MSSTSYHTHNSSSNKDPQKVLNDFWDQFIHKAPTKVTSVLPPSLQDGPLPAGNANTPPRCRPVAASYEAAAAECIKKVDAVVRQCRLKNEKFTDHDFDLESDFNLGKWNCFHSLLTKHSCPAAAPAPPVSIGELRKGLDTILAAGVLTEENTTINLEAMHNALREPPDSCHPAAVHRVDYVFDNPSFTVDGFDQSDVSQGRADDCWWLSAVSTMCNVTSLVEKICVKHDQECGVYGFVFYRDGEWISTVVDDNLYLSEADFEGNPYDSNGEKGRAYKREHQTGSEALYFARCKDKDETWLPLLEKAFAKVHGDYDALDGGCPGDAVEDLTGGVTTTIMLNRVLDRNLLWDQLTQANKDFLFALSTPPAHTDAVGGLTASHAYSVLEARDVQGEDGKSVRLVLIRNPWGKRDPDGMGEWNGPWSDGAKEWTAHWMKELNHQFGDDGKFWMSYDDVLRNFDVLARTRLFDDKEGWTVIEQWTSVDVSWTTETANTRFLIELKKPGPVVIVLSQLDYSYFKGLKGQYDFELSFVLKKEDADATEPLVVVHSQVNNTSRSVSTDIVIEPGKYEVVPTIKATRDLTKRPVECTVLEFIESNPQKLRQIGLNYDVAHAKEFRAKSTAEKAPSKLGRDPPQVSEHKEPIVNEGERDEGDWETEDDQRTSRSMPSSCNPDRSEIKDNPWNAIPGCDDEKAARFTQFQDGEENSRGEGKNEEKRIQVVQDDREPSQPFTYRGKEGAE